MWCRIDNPQVPKENLTWGEMEEQVFFCWAFHLSPRNCEDHRRHWLFCRSLHTPPEFGQSPLSTIKIVVMLRFGTQAFQFVHIS
jgi:hypothetical protein